MGISNPSQITPRNLNFLYIGLMDYFQNRLLIEYTIDQLSIIDSIYFTTSSACCQSIFLTLNLVGIR